MGQGKFILIGDDKKILAGVKNTLVADGYLYIGYTNQTQSVLRTVRKTLPDLIILEVQDRFYEQKEILEVIDDELLAPCVLVLKMRSDEVLQFVRQSKIMTYIMKPLYDEVLLQIADLSISHFNRVVEYEHKLKKINENLAARKVIEKAKWLIVEKRGLSENEAYDFIRKKSRDNRLPMKEVAQAILLTEG